MVAFQVVTSGESLLALERVPAEMRSMGRDAFTIHVSPTFLPTMRLYRIQHLFLVPSGVLR